MPEPQDLTKSPFEPYLPPALGYTAGATFAYWRAGVTTRIVARSQAAILAAKQTIMEAEIDLALCQLDGRKRVADALRAAEESEAETQALRHFRTLSPAEARQSITTQEDIEHRLAAREHWRQTRLTGRGLATHAAGQPVAITAPPVLELTADIGARQIERESLLAAAQLSAAPRTELRQRYNEWMDGLRKRLPDYAVQEVMNRTDELMALMGGDE